MFAGVEGVRGADIHGVFAEVSYEGSVNAVLEAAMVHEVVNLRSRDADLEEIFLAYYRETDDRDGTDRGDDTHHRDASDATHRSDDTEDIEVTAAAVPSRDKNRVR